MDNIVKVLVIIFIVVFYMMAIMSRKGLYTSLGVCFGMLIGKINDNLALGLCLGLIVGAVIDGVNYINKKKKNSNS